MLEFKKDNLKAALTLILPMSLLAIFTFWPIINALRTAFMENYTLFPNTYDGIGFGNFESLFTSTGPDGFWASILNTLYIVAITVPLTIIVGLFVAVGLNSIKRFQGLYQTIFFLPYVTNTIALGLVFNALFSKSGVVNSLFNLNIDWVSSNASKLSALTVLAIYTVWNGLAFKVIVFLSGMQGIDKQYYQAAQVDSTSKWRMFTKITVPLISPMILYITITSFIGAFKTYSSVISIFGTKFYGPGSNKNLLRPIVGFIYDQMDAQLGINIGIGAAASIILFIIILAITLVQFKVSKKRVHY